MAGLALANANPGNIKDPATGSFKQFSNPGEGYAALLNDLEAKKRGNTSTGLGPNSTLVEFAEKYAPASDNNNPGQYAANLANFMGVRPDTPIGQLDTGKWAEAVSMAEDHEFAQSQGIGYPKPGEAMGTGTVPGYAPPQAPMASDGLGLPEQPQERFKGTGLVGNIQDIAHGAGKGGLETVLGIGHLGQGIQGLVGRGIDAVSGGRTNFAEDAQKGVLNPNTQSGQAIRDSLKATNTAEKIGKGIETAAEIAVPVGKVSGLVKAPAAAEVAASRIGKIAESITPHMTPTEAASALERFGGTKAGLFKRASINPDPTLKKLAESVEKHVPGFKAGGSSIENLNATKKAVGRLAEDLKDRVVASGKDRVYPIRELAADMEKAIQKDDVSIGLKGTQFEKQAQALKDAALEITRQKGGKVSELLDARKEFDALVDKIYPNLYEKEYTPIRNAVKSVRDTMTNFTEKHLPQDVALKDSLKNQSNLIRVVENLAEKAVKGGEKEVGKNNIASYLNKHPILKETTKYGLGALGGGTLFGVGKSLLD